MKIIKLFLELCFLLEEFIFDVYVKIFTWFADVGFNDWCDISWVNGTVALWIRPNNKSIKIIKLLKIVEDD